MLQGFATVVVFAGPALWEFFHPNLLSSVTAADFWWHLQTGLEILRSHTLPHAGWFSQSATQPWIASSWLYDVLVAIGFRWLDLRLLPLLAAVAKLALAIVVFILAGGTRGRLWAALALSAIAQYLLLQMPPLPVFCSVLALAIELFLLMDFRSSGRLSSLYSLPLLFVVWANLDFHFVYGILTLALFVAVCVAERSTIQSLACEHNSASMTTIAAIAGGGSLIESFVTPYGWNSYRVFWATSAASAYFPDDLSLRFRSPQDYVLMLLAMAAFLSLGLRRSRDVFQIALLVLGTMAAFHSQRDSWLAVVASVCGACKRRDGANRERASRRSTAVTDYLSSCNCNQCRDPSGRCRHAFAEPAFCAGAACRDLPCRCG